ncbi:ATP-binding cassette domain-containing protein [Dactylosporangium sucinum]|uniref:ABC transporter n=1 Tax=Dactylosporangium sucinum TaxID=1424081 RepID=A0A917UFT7_9ACTN|nr:branched-chain amino acid ABC transporter permease/ATP-binding protein [Dactylosporangium sucinum]GGM89749.1 ABC transporter [Dactylosporangium sucinum]
MDIPATTWSITSDMLVFGLLTGLAYAILAAGIVLVYRATKVINLAHGEIGAFGAVLLAKMVLDWHWNFWLALAATLVCGAAIGAVVEMGVIRRLAKAPRLILLVATLGVGQLVFLGRVLLPEMENYGSFPSPLDREANIGGVVLSSPHFMMLAFVPAVIVGLTVFLTRTPFGLAVRASADNPDRAKLAGVPVMRVSTTVWAISGALAVLTVALLNPMTGAVVGLPTASVGPGLLVHALAAALVGGLTSMPRAMVGGLAVGLIETVMVSNGAPTGSPELVLFLAILVLTLLRRPGMGGGADGLGITVKTPPIPSAMRNVWWVRRSGLIGAVVAVAVAALLPLVFTTSADQYMFTRVLIFALVGLSVTVLAGWAGQLTLGQFGFVGIGALVATQLASNGVPFLAAVAQGAVAGGLAAFVVGLPALRVEGPFLAVTTLAFAVACQSWLYGQGIFGEGPTYTFPAQRLFGLDLSSERTFYLLTLAIVVVCAAAVVRLRRTGAGISMIAVRDNDRAASSFAVAPVGAKLSAFIFAGALAGLAGGLYAAAAGQYGLASATSPAIFGPEQSTLIISMVVIGGLGRVSGSILGAIYLIGLPAVLGDSFSVSLATSGIGVLVLILFLPGGLTQLGLTARSAILSHLTRGRAAVPDPVRPPIETLPRPEPVLVTDPAAPAIAVTGVNVSFGGRIALKDASLTVARGEVVGVIGANGAGKSTLMNVISGFVRPQSGRIEIGGVDVTSFAPHQRAALGMGRVFQDARLFGDLTVHETVRVALEARDRSAFVPSLLALPGGWARERRKFADADSYIDFLGLGRYAHSLTSELSTGTRRIVEMCCLLAQGADVLMLDEPTGGVAQKESEAFGPLIKSIQRELSATVVIIEHDMPLTMSISDRMYCYSAGQLIAEGTPEVVRDNPDVVAAYLGTDRRAIERSDSLISAGGSA